MKLNVKQTIFVGLAFLIISMFWQVYDNIIAKMLIEAFGFNQVWSGVILALDNVLALFLLPLFGKISDGTKTKFGKRTPYIAIGIVLSAILFIGVALTHTSQVKLIEDAGIQDVVEITNGEDEVISYEYDGVAYTVEQREDAIEARRVDVWAVSQGNATFLITFIGVLFVVLLVMSIYRTPAVALMPDVTPKPLRSKANAIINLMGSAGGIIALLFITVITSIKKAQGVVVESSYVLEFVTLAILMIGLLCVFLWRVKEPKLVEKNDQLIKEFGVDNVETIQEETAADMSPAVRKSFYLILLSIVFWFMAYNAATSKFSVYATQVLKMGYTLPLLMAQGAAIIVFIPIGIIASKIGRKKTILIGICILFTAFILGTIANANTTFLIYITMAMAGIGWATINVNSYPMVVEMSKGANIGKYTGYYYSASMFAQIVTPILSGWIMTQFFNNNMRPLFPYCVVFCVLAFITMSNVKHGDSKPIPVKNKIEAFEAMED